MAPILYCAIIRPPVRAVLLTAHAIDLQLNYKYINIPEKENMTPEYLKMNPQHTIPTMDDDGFILWDSHAIAAYLVSKYGKNDLLYPKDLKKRALVDQRLHFDGGILFPQMCTLFRPILFGNEKIIAEEKKIKVEEAYHFLNAFLDGRQWLAGEHVTIADLCTIASISSLNVVIPVSGEKFPRLRLWMTQCESLPYYQKANGPGLEELTALFKQKLQ